MPGNATVGQFVVGDGTLVGQTQLDATVVVGKATLVLNGKAFEGVIYTGDFFVAAFVVKPKLILASKQATILSDSTAAAGKGTLILSGKPVTLVVPEFAHMAKSTLVLRGGAVELSISAIEDFGKPTLYLNGKVLSAAIPGLTPSVPWDLILTPSVPAEGLLVPSVPRTADLVPSVVEFR